jgi:hypothetical protein
MAFSQFDLSNMVRCQATDEEGYRCIRRPSHDDEHRWNRCETKDAEGHRCALPLRHPGDHYPPWYDRETKPGETHTINYSGTERQAGAIAEKATQVASGYGWIVRSRTFTPEAAWQSALFRWLGGGDVPKGRLQVIFEYQPAEQPAS